MAKRDILVFDDSTNPGQIQEPQAADTPLIRRDYYLTTGIRFSEVNDGASAVGHVLDTEDPYTTAGAKLLSVRNNGTEDFYVDKDGGFGNGDLDISHSGSESTIAGSGTIQFTTTGNEPLRLASAFGLDDWRTKGATGCLFTGEMTDGAGKYQWTFRSENVLSNATAYLARFQNSNVDKMTITQDGKLEVSLGIGLHGNSPPAQHSSTGDTTGFVAGSGTSANDDSEWDGDSGTTGYTVGDIVSALKDIGILAA